jgi:hypothetical protein
MFIASCALRTLQRVLELALSGWGLIVCPAAYLALSSFALQGRFPQTLDLIHDWYNHAVYFGGFLFGFSIAKSDVIWAALERLRVRTLIGALVSYTIIGAYVASTLKDGAANPAPLPCPTRRGRSDWGIRTVAMDRGRVRFCMPLPEPSRRASAALSDRRDLSLLHHPHVDGRGRRLLPHQACAGRGPGVSAADRRDNPQLLRYL